MALGGTPLVPNLPYVGPEVCGTLAGIRQVSVGVYRNQATVSRQEIWGGSQILSRAIG